MPSLSYTGNYLPSQYRTREGEFIRNDNRTLKVIRIRFYYLTQKKIFF